jgi:hypothetical protein
MTDDVARARECADRLETQGKLIGAGYTTGSESLYDAATLLRSLAQQVEEMEKERDHYMNFAVVDAGSNTTVLWKDRALAAEAKLASVREALVHHNDRLRSAAQIGYREGADTNWKSFRGACTCTLAEYHELVNEAREALSLLGGE